MEKNELNVALTSPYISLLGSIIETSKNGGDTLALKKNEEFQRITACYHCPDLYELIKRGAKQFIDELPEILQHVDSTLTKEAATDIALFQCIQDWVKKGSQEQAEVCECCSSKIGNEGTDGKMLCTQCLYDKSVLTESSKTQFIVRHNKRFEKELYVAKQRTLRISGLGWDGGLKRFTVVMDGKMCDIIDHFANYQDDQFQSYLNIIIID